MLNEDTITEDLRGYEYVNEQRMDELNEELKKCNSQIKIWLMGIVGAGLFYIIFKNGNVAFLGFMSFFLMALLDKQIKMSELRTQIEIEKQNGIMRTLYKQQKSILHHAAHADGAAREIIEHLNIEE